MEMKTVIKKVLELNEEEILWLKRLLQNPLVCQNCQEEFEESIEDAEMRRRFWENLERG